MCIRDRHGGKNRLHLIEASVNGRRASRGEFLEESQNWMWNAGAPVWVFTYLKLKAWVQCNKRLPDRYPIGRRPKRAFTAEEDVERSLAQWVVHQRVVGRGGKERLDTIHEYIDGRRASRAQFLEELNGWVWNVDSEKWVDMYLKVKAWITGHDGNFPRQHPLGRTSGHKLTETEAEEHRLGNWISYQRTRRRGGKDQMGLRYEVVNGHRASCAQHLEELQGWWWSNSQRRRRSEGEGGAQGTATKRLLCGKDDKIVYGDWIPLSLEDDNHQEPLVKRGGHV